MEPMLAQRQLAIEIRLEGIEGHLKTVLMVQHTILEALTHIIRQGTTTMSTVKEIQDAEAARNAAEKIVLDKLTGLASQLAATTAQLAALQSQGSINPDDLTSIVQDMKAHTASMQAIVNPPAVDSGASAGSDAAASGSTGDTAAAGATAGSGA